MMDADARVTLVVELAAYAHADAATRLAVRETSAALRAAVPRGGALRSWQEVRRARVAWRAWRAGTRRAPRRPYVRSWARRRLHDDDTPVLRFA